MPKRLTKEQIEALIDKVEYRHFYNKVTICLLTLTNKFVLVAHSGTIDPDNFSREIGESTAYNKALDRLWELEGYASHCEQKAIDVNEEYSTKDSLEAFAKYWSTKSNTEALHVPDGTTTIRFSVNGKSYGIDVKIAEAYLTSRRLLVVQHEGEESDELLEKPDIIKNTLRKLYSDDYFKMLYPNG